MKKLLSVASLLVFVFIRSANSAPLYTITQLTDNNYGDTTPFINDSGQIAWSGGSNYYADYNLFFYEGGNTTQLTLATGKGNYIGDMNSSGDLIFSRSDSNWNNAQIYRYTNSSKSVTYVNQSDELGKINDNGIAVWQQKNIGASPSWDREINSSTGIITANGNEDYKPEINNSGNIVWYGQGQSGAFDIYLYKNATITQLTSTSFDELNPKINEAGYITWYGGQTNGANPNNNEIWLYNGTSTTLITNDATYDNQVPVINNKGQIAFIGKGGNTSSSTTDYEVFFYDGTNVIQITNNNNSLYQVELNNNGWIVWSEYDGTDNEIFLYDGTGVYQLTDNNYNDYGPKMNNLGDIVWYGNYQSGDHEIFYAKYEGQSGSAVPEPATVLLFISSIGVFYFRKRNSR